MTAVDREMLPSLLPHSGKMCLLDQVSGWDDQHIRSTAVSHRASDNPLRVDGRLPIEAGIEYAAQAMAIHGSLCGGAAEKPRVGYLVVLSRVSWSRDFLDDVDGEIAVYAEKLVATADGSHYQFSVEVAGENVLSGQAVVALASEAVG